MRVVRRVAELRRLIADERARGSSIGFVPTMGALHEGHLSLVRLAHQQSDIVVVSVFVNRLQFGEGEDFDHYPRDTEGDLELLEGEDAHIVFLPSEQDMYPKGATTRVSPGPLADLFEGADRPGHFEGVCTVVAKLFHMVAPDAAFFGQKDAQQVAVLRRMTADLAFDIDIVVGDTARESNGLAMSSRNAYLSPEERSRATVLYRSLCEARSTLEETSDPETAEKAMWDVLGSEEGVEPSYAAAVDPETFGPPGPSGTVLFIVAARVGPARLIDNMLASRG